MLLWLFGQAGCIEELDVASGDFVSSGASVEKVTWSGADNFKLECPELADFAC